MYQDTFKHNGYTIRLMPGYPAYYRLRYKNQYHKFDNLQAAEWFIDQNK